MAANANTLNFPPAPRSRPILTESSEIAASSPGLRLHFGSFSLDPRSGELTGPDGTVVLQWQPLQLLLMLIEAGGELVTREEIQERLWGHDVIVDFDHSINQLVRKLRRVLGDSAEEPNYVETLARRGYRFKLPVEVTEKPNAHRTAASISRFATGKLLAIRKAFDDGEAPASGRSSSLRLREIAAAPERRRVAPHAMRCRRRNSYNPEERRDNLAPLVRRLAAQPLRECLGSATPAEKLDALRQLLMLVTEVLEGC